MCRHQQSTAFMDAPLLLGFTEDQLDEGVLSALPEDIRREVWLAMRQQSQHKQTRQEVAAGGSPAPRKANQQTAMQFFKQPAIHKKQKRL